LSSNFSKVTIGFVLFIDEEKMSHTFKSYFLTLLAVIIQAGCASGPPPLHAITLEAGPNWKANTPPEGQDLIRHFKYMKDLFDQKRLVANGPTADDNRGFYLFRSDKQVDINEIVRNDPAIQSGVLKVTSISAWTLGIENMGADAAGNQVFILNYLPGPTWNAAVTLDKQPTFGDTVKYVTAAFDKGRVLAAGPVSDKQARSVFLAPNLASAQEFAKNDPGTASGLFAIEVKPWIVLQRQSLK
jgi:uncharacterized protein YciI